MRVKAKEWKWVEIHPLNQGIWVENETLVHGKSIYSTSLISMRNQFHTSKTLSLFL
ncbi:hypothetical protein VIBNIAM115_1920052 [Vibrio nigripulchritudo AM115]|nr:hypothetical protein VIBNIAM115_1920052 [Vibrio nigripulchritudo AM115]